MACLSSRIPHGEPVTPEKLAMIEQAENLLRDLGFYDVRVRHHEMRGARGEVRGTSNDRLSPLTSDLSLYLARIEVGPSEMAKLLSDDVAGRVAAALKQIGYAHVTLDLQGYRRGSFNQVSSSESRVLS